MRGRKSEFRGDEEKNRQKEESREVTGLKPRMSTTQLKFERLSSLTFFICANPEAFLKQPFKSDRA